MRHSCGYISYSEGDNNLNARYVIKKEPKNYTVKPFEAEMLQLREGAADCPAFPGRIPHG